MDVYLHVRVLLSMILGLGVGHLLRGVSRIVQHPRKYKIYWVHLVWTLFLFLYLIHFWWWEFYLQKVGQWTFPLYFFIAIYATLLFLLCSLFYPDEMGEYDGYRGYFYSRLLLAVINGTGMYITLRAFSVPFAAPLAIFEGLVSEFIPIVGTYIAGAAGMARS